MSDYVLELKGVCKAFPGVQALDHVDFRLRPGTVHALMGENGAGKSTLMKCLFGVYTMDEGEIIYEGAKVKIASPFDALRRGIAMCIKNSSPYRSVPLPRMCSAAGIRAECQALWITPE
jgi:methyl-galactoside transport system ATP-binding protein